MDPIWLGLLALGALYACSAVVEAMLDSEAWYAMATGFLFFLGFVGSTAVLVSALLTLGGVLG